MDYLQRTPSFETIGIEINEQPILRQGIRTKLHRLLIACGNIEPDGRFRGNGEAWWLMLDGFHVIAIDCQCVYPWTLKAQVTYLGKIPDLSPIVPVHQSDAFSVLLVIVMISPFLKARSPG